ncbi:MAG: 4-(cytidine 5'-diphospho)-2-C-methyl-D-erythritol kinase, partial [Candidatus Omnitrophica bacterium]|nr:4-(cytidine 5'-diphospho)-2-C-methyl-D-erythritol kinase [Candidatus Omnitrophota bacterium]
MIHLRAPAKLNLSLRVLGKRPDGYHEIETLFERIDLADELTFEDGPRQLTLTCSDPTLSCGEDNLILKAARLLQATVGASRGARIHLVKRIPVAAGLGGGSSDAATTLMGLSRLWGLELEPPQLRSLAAQLGSDVPFFLSETPFAIGRGRGELCEPIPQAPVLSHVLVVPNERLSTKAVYEGFSLTGAPPSLTMMQHALSNGS